MDEEFHISGGKSRPRQVRKVREDGWTAKKKGIFLDHLAATCNATRSAIAAGMHRDSAFARRRRDPEFAEQWDAALHAAKAGLDGMLIERSMFGGKKPEVPIGETPVPDPATMDPELALKMLAHHRSSLAGERRRGGPKPRRATRGETEAAILKKLKALKKRRGG